MWNRKEFDKRRYKSFLFPMLQIWTNRRLKIFCAICLKSQFILRFFFFNTTNLNTFYYLLGSKESINIFYSLMGLQSCLPKAMKIKSKAASMGRGLQFSITKNTAEVKTLHKMKCNSCSLKNIYPFRNYMEIFSICSFSLKTSF